MSVNLSLPLALRGALAVGALLGGFSACSSPSSSGTTKDAAAPTDANHADRRAADAAPVDAHPFPTDAPLDGGAAEAPAAVYTTTNNVAGNAILVFPRAKDGSLSSPSSYSTGGLGSEMLFDDSQGALVFDPVQRLFVAVNTGDSTVGMLSLQANGVLELLSNVPSGGLAPTSVTLHHDLIYVLNAGVQTDASVTAGNISGFRITTAGLFPISGSTQPLSSGSVNNPAQIQFTPDGTRLVVTERLTSLIDTYVVDSSGVAGPPTVQPSSGMTPYGFGFSAGGQLIVSEAHGGAINLSSMSSYSIAGDGTLTPISKAIPTHQSDDCWIAIAGPYVYGTNTKPSDNITGMTISPGGALTLLDDSGVTGVTGQGCTDEAITPDSQFLYNINAIDQSISIFHIEANGSLTKLPDYTGIPDFAAGLVAR